MSIARDLTSLEILEIAIRSEMDSAALYRKMGNMIRNKDLQARLARLEAEEKKHRAALEELFERMFPETEPQLPRKSFTPLVTAALHDNASVKELLHAAMESEKISELFYRDLARKSTNIQGSSILMYLANVERNHFDILRSELDFLESSPQYLESNFSDIADGLTHIGP